MGIKYDIANKNDISELIRLRYEYIKDDFGKITDEEKAYIEKELPLYFERKLNRGLYAFIARCDNKIIATAYLLIMEKIPNPSLPNGLDGEILSVYTEEAYRKQGISTRILTDLIKFAKLKGLCRVQLKATESGYPMYKKLGFEEFGLKYKNMRLKLK